MKRIEDLNSEVRSLQGTKEQKDLKLKMQIKTNEDLLHELEKANMTVFQLKQSQEETQ